MFIECPHCQLVIEIIELNCGIFRCGINKNTLIQIDPHLPKEQCDLLVHNNTIYGCGKPFLVKKTSIINNEIHYEVSICDYI
jgi:hypothetical protein